MYQTLRLLLIVVLSNPLASFYVQGDHIGHRDTVIALLLQVVCTLALSRLLGAVGLFIAIPTAEILALLTYFILSLLCSRQTSISFQLRSGLTADGEYGKNTHATLLAVLADHGEDDSSGAEKAVKAATVEITGGSANIRTGNGTGYACITAAKKGTALEYVATAVNGWHAVVINGQVGWVSEKEIRYNKLRKKE